MPAGNLPRSTSQSYVGRCLRVDSSIRHSVNRVLSVWPCFRPNRTWHATTGVQATIKLLRIIALRRKPTKQVECPACMLEMANHRHWQRCSTPLLRMTLVASRTVLIACFGGSPRNCFRGTRSKTTGPHTLSHRWIHLITIL